MKLHLGCGKNIKEGYVNIDSYVEAPGIEKNDIFNLPYEDNSIDEILTEHLIEHIKFKDEDHAVSIANDTRFGLGSGVWTSDIGRAFRMSERIQAGTVWVNTYRAVSYMSPFGGYKDSGMGRENGMDAIHDYLQVKSVWINTGATTSNPFTMR